jgi:alkanesulfonate monooxygenase
MSPPLAKELFPGILISGSSDAGLAAARAVGAVAVQYPKPAKEYESTGFSNGSLAGVRIGIIARERGADAWAAACERFPGDRKGQIAHELAMKVSDSHWHLQLSEMAKEIRSSQSVYWMWPFENYKTFCPYLVGSYDEVAEELSCYLRIGYRTFILDVPPDPQELRSAQIAFQMASKQALS